MTTGQLQIAFITGRSDPDCWLLSPLQDAFIQQLIAPDRQLIERNFPYTEQHHAHYKVPPLIKASYRNAREYLSSRKPDFINRYQSAVMAIIDQAPHTLFLAGSCGLELFNNLKLPTERLDKVSVFAYGPVARQRPECYHQLVQGRSDPISRLWFRHADSYVNCSHLDYLSNPELLDHCQRFIHSIGDRINRT